MLTKADIDNFITVKKQYDESFWRVCELGERVTGSPSTTGIFDRIELFLEAATLCNASIRPLITKNGFKFEYRDELFFYIREDGKAEEVE